MRWLFFVLEDNMVVGKVVVALPKLGGHFEVTA